MSQEPAKLPLAELRARLAARANQVNYVDSMRFSLRGADEFEYVVPAKAGMPCLRLTESYGRFDVRVWPPAVE